MRSFLLSLFLLMGSVFLQSQNTIFSDTLWLSDDPNSLLVNFGNLNIGDCSENTASISAGLFVTALSYSTTGTAYGHGTRSFLPEFQPGLFRVEGTTSGTGYGIGLRLTSPNDPLISAMGCDYNSGVYTAGWAIQRFYPDTDIANPEDDSLSFRGFLPPEMRAAGGMTYRNGQFYITTESNTLVAVDVENAANSTVVATFPDNDQVLDAMISFPYRCDSIVTYVFGRDTTGTTVYTLDFEDYSLEEYCRLDKKLFAVATPEECIQPPCEMYVDLDEDDSAGLDIHDYQIDTICRSFSGVGDIDAKVFSVLDLDSIVVALTEHPDGLMDQLYGPMSTTNITVATRTPFRRYVLINNGTANFADFEALLQAFSFTNIKPDLTYGPRQIFVQAHSNIYSSEPALMHFYIGDGAIDTQPQVTAPSCFGETDGAITLQPTGAMGPFSFIWEDGSTGDSRINLSAGAYAVTVTAAEGCTAQDTIIVGEPASLVLELDIPADTICANSGQITAVVSGGTAPYTYAWDNGELQANLNDVAAGSYTLVVEDANTCRTQATALLVARDTIYTFQEEMRCEGEAILVNDISYATDTSFCLISQSLQGCDSIHCVTLQFLDTILVQEFIELCPGEIHRIDDLVLSRDTSLCWVGVGSNGCDSTYCLQLDILDEATPLQASICPGDAYPFANIDRTEPGIYRDTVPGSRGCDSIIELQLSFSPAPTIDWQVDGSFCTQPTVTLSPGVHTNYQWSNGSSSSSIIATTPGRYEVTVSNAQACTATALIELSSNELDFSINAVAPICPGENTGSLSVIAVTGGVGPYLYSLNESPFQVNPVFTALPAGTYGIRVEDTEGCQLEQVATLMDSPFIGLSAPLDQTLSLGDTLPLTVTTQNTNASIRWSPPIGLACDTCYATQAFPSYTTAYQVTARDEQGCEESTRFTLTVDRSLGLFIPNAISPNDDGVNDHLVIYTDASIQSLHNLSIYNRWGVLVYQQENPVAGQENWDGAFNNQLLPTGVYIYQMEIERVDGIRETLSGELLLLR